MTLGGKTINEIYISREAANEQPRSESRKLWPRGSPGAKPQVDTEGKPGDLASKPHSDTQMKSM
ncbi:MAG: hypothetical protein ACI814_004852 [Mariniblastus sp.]|jgi:hypothetical protein